MSTKFGAPVTMDQAKTYVETYKSLRDTLIDNVFPKNSAPPNDDVRQSIEFHTSEANAFIFDAELVAKFFETPNPAKYFMIFLGADGVKPTIVLTGVKDGEKENTFVSLGFTKPPVQHPKIKVDAVFPPNMG